ncbi:2-oxoglutarate dehydrogenase E1 component [Salinisphaera sp. USBA-960]|uniref:2-oxoglutarate dehydrogenase E1 component n=1 Tax=Salinisphaera orenii TaxID=856731 RepID=UPI000DBEA288|nr:2-oxoglutarate dehydrogenase E1 component [Salifodinibacter halophilus]NNC26046.1 2-oxoglutarate dehydrogenase E1 component [Salifodinibacter halophilus]
MNNELNDQFIASSALFGANAAYVEAYYEQYLHDPDSVDAAWRDYFDRLHVEQAQAEVAHGPIRESFVDTGASAAQGAKRGGDQGMSALAAEKQAAVLRLINYYRVRGHQVADLDPLGLAEPPHVADLDPAFHGLDKSDMQSTFNVGSLFASRNEMRLDEIIDFCQRAYTSTIGSEYMHLTDTDQKRWIQRRIESSVDKTLFDSSEKREMLRQLTAAEGIERYLHTKYVGQKRFSLEGADSMVPALDELIRSSAHHNVDEMVVGMAHRGRLNVLLNVLGKSPEELFSEFEDDYDVNDIEMSGDVKYHLGFSTDIEYDNKRVHLTLAFNPSHLEAVNPVVLGSVRARQTLRGDDNGETVLPVLIHGDASFAGQGIVMETLQLSQAEGYATGGTVHFVMNNQVGFTMNSPIELGDARSSRSSRYCTDIAKILEAPVFHVNGDDTEAVVYATRLAMEFRNTFNKDVLVDVVCYRRQGHNEADEPAVTQPLMYQAIKNTPTTRKRYARRLEAEGIIQEDAGKTFLDDYRAGLDQNEHIYRSTLGFVGNDYTVDWKRFSQGKWSEVVDTAVPVDRIQTVAGRLHDLPEEFTLHKRAQRIIDDRRKMTAGGQRIDWGFAEHIAYATLIDDGYSVRLSGQDSGRGTFFHRHSVLYDQGSGKHHVPLKHIRSENRYAFTVNDTLLSEAGVVGFEYGYATADPDTLTIWEAQFGDFVNGAQVLIDQFIASGYAKWGRMCALTMFLPHGYEGQGPEHSSARLERFLQLCAERHMLVTVPSTPAQWFHLLRLQMIRDLRMPLIVLSPKSLLRHPMSTSTLEDLSEGRFEFVIDDPAELDRDKVERIVFCSGKVFFDLYKARDEREIDNVALVRIEQLYPFPAEDYAAVLNGYPNASEVVWCQEEPENQGAWYQIKHRLQVPLADHHALLYATRPGAATTAAGYHQLHVKQQNAVIEAALTGGEPLIERGSVKADPRGKKRGAQATQTSKTA